MRSVAVMRSVAYKVFLARVHLQEKGLTKDFFIFGKGLLQTPNIENIEKNSGFPGKLLSKGCVIM